MDGEARRLMVRHGEVMKATATIPVDLDSARRVGLDLESTAESLAVRVRQTAAVTDRISLEQARTDREMIGALMLRVAEFFRPMKAMAHQLHATICAREKEILEPLARVDREKVDAIKAFNDAEERERRRLEAEESGRRKREEESRAEAEAAALEKQGEHELAAAVIAEAIAAPAPVVVLPSATAGVVTFTRRYHWKFAGGPKVIAQTPPDLIRRAMALLPEEFKTIDEKKVGAYVRSMKTSARIAGLDIYYEDEPRR
jgi:hypothetical protein